MAIKTFTAAEKLTASDTNTFLANAGLVHVTETSFSAVTGVNVDNCFTSTMANYRLVLDITTISASDIIFFQYRNSSGTYTTADYDAQLLECHLTSVTGASLLGQSSNRISFSYATPGLLSATIDVFNPQAAFRTSFISQGLSPFGTTFILKDDVAGAMRVTTSFTGIRISTSGGTSQLTGRIRIYGYRNS